MAFLVNESKSIAQRELVSEIYKQGNLEELMVEDPVISQTREQRKKEIKALRSAQSLLNDVQQSRFWEDVLLYSTVYNNLKNPISMKP